MKFNLLVEKQGNQFTYTITEKDRLDLTRAVAREGNPPLAVTYALLQRFAWLYPAYKSLSEFVKAYAQPINPRWFPDGDKHLAYISSLKKRKAPNSEIRDAEEKAKARVTYANASYNDIPPQYTEIVLEVLRNKIKNPVKGAVHYIASQAPHNISEASAQLLQQQYADNRTDLTEPILVNSSRAGNNWFFKVEGSENLGLNLIETEDTGLRNDDKLALVFILYGAAAQKLKEYLSND